MGYLISNKNAPKLRRLLDSLPPDGLDAPPNKNSARFGAFVYITADMIEGDSDSDSTSCDESDQLGYYPCSLVVYHPETSDWEEVGDALAFDPTGNALTVGGFYPGFRYGTVNCLLPVYAVANGSASTIGTLHTIEVVVHPITWDCTGDCPTVVYNTKFLTGNFIVSDLPDDSDSGSTEAPSCCPNDTAFTFTLSGITNGTYDAHWFNTTWNLTSADGITWIEVKPTDPNTGGETSVQCILTCDPSGFSAMSFFIGASHGVTFFKEGPMDCEGTNIFSFNANECTACANWSAVSFISVVPV